MDASSFIDPSLRRRGAPTGDRRRRAPGLAFVEAGTYIAAAAASRGNAGAGSALAALGGAAPPPPPPPRPARVQAPTPPVEWWDAKLLLDGSSYEAGAAAGTFDASSNLNVKKITLLVDHPVPRPPAVPTAPTEPPPLRLTAKERKKLRTQRRAERQAEKVELVRQGLLPPPEPKVRLANLARVLGAASVADPTAVEAEVRRAAAARAAAHEDRNLAAALTPAERRAKKLAKLLGDAAAPTDGAPFPADLYAIIGPAMAASNKLKFKVRANADELHVTGFAAVAPRCAAVLVAGGAKPLKKFARLMTARIAWDAPDGVAGAAVDDDDAPPFQPSRCVRVWSGAVAAPLGDRFWFAVHPDAASARAALEARGCGAYWDVVSAAAMEEDGGADGARTLAAGAALEGGGGGGGGAAPMQHG